MKNINKTKIFSIFVAVVIAITATSCLDPLDSVDDMSNVNIATRNIDPAIWDMMCERGELNPILDHFSFMLMNMLICFDFADLVTHKLFYERRFLQLQDLVDKEVCGWSSFVRKSLDCHSSPHPWLNADFFIENFPDIRISLIGGSIEELRDRHGVAGGNLLDIGLIVVYRPCDYDPEWNYVLPGYRDNVPYEIDCLESFNGFAFLVEFNIVAQVDRMQYNKDFEAFAINVSMMLQCQEFREILKAEVLSMFDGDYNVLVSQLLVNHPHLRDMFNQFHLPNYMLVDDMIQKYPLIQIAIPIHVELWDVFDYWSIPPVVFIPYELEDNVEMILQGFHAWNQQTISSYHEPDFPVVVISENERTKIFPAGTSGNIEDLVPSPPRNLTEATTARGIRLTWQRPTSGIVTGYDVYRRAGYESSFQRITTLYGGQNTFFEDRNVGSEQVYAYYVKAFFEAIDEWYITEDDPYTLIQVPPNFRVSSGASDMVVGTSPTLAVPTGLRLEHGNAGQLVLEWNAQTFASGFEVWRTSTNNHDFTLQATVMENTFIQSGLSAGVFHRYRIRALAPDGTPSNWSNSAATSVSERNIEDPLRLTKFRFRNVQALRRVESWVRGGPELYLTIVAGDNQGARKVTRVGFRPSRRNSHSQWNYVNRTILHQWNPNRDGTIFTFSWVEQDSRTGNRGSVTVSTSFEDRLSDTQTVRSGVNFTYDIASSDDIMGTDNVVWWHRKDTRYEVYPGFYWYMK